MKILHCNKKYYIYKYLLSIMLFCFLCVNSSRLNIERRENCILLHITYIVIIRDRNKF